MGWSTVEEPSLGSMGVDGSIIRVNESHINSGMDS